MFPDTVILCSRAVALRPELKIKVAQYLDETRIDGEG